MPRVLRDESSKPRRVNEFVGVAAVWKQAENPFAHALNKQFRVVNRHIRLHDQGCRNIDKLSYFPRTARFVRKLFCGWRTDHWMKRSPIEALGTIPRAREEISAPAASGAQPLLVEAQQVAVRRHRRALAYLAEHVDERRKLGGELIEHITEACRQPVARATRRRARRVECSSRRRRGFGRGCRRRIPK